MTNLSPARQHLADHLERIKHLEAERERLQRPVSRLKDQLDHALAKLTEAEQNVATADAECAKVLADAARSGDDVLVRIEPAKLGEVGTARRTIATIEAALSECQAEADAAAADLAQAKAETDAFKIAVAMEEHADAIERRERARKAFNAAEADVIGLNAALYHQGQPGPGASIDHKVAWLQAGEKGTTTLSAKLPPGPEYSETNAAKDRWLATIARLGSDAGAR